MSDRRPSIQFRLDPRSAVAPYRQLVEQVQHAVSTGRLRGGDQLPSVREVVTQVTINPNTVHRAYRELEHLGLAEGRTGLGTFVTAHPGGAATRATRDELASDLRRWARKARAAGLGEAELHALVRRVIDHDLGVRP